MPTIHREERPRREQKVTLILLVGILLAAFGLRLYRLDAGPWFDEIWVYTNTATVPVQQMLQVPNPQDQHFLYDFFAHISFWILGQSIWSLRLPAVIFGVGSLWALYLFARTVAEAREALLAVGLLAFSYHHIWFSQNARGYTALLFFTLISSWLFLSSLDEQKLRRWPLYAVTVTLGLFAHMTMIFVVLAHLGLYIVSIADQRGKGLRIRWTGPTLGFSLAGALTILVYAPMLPKLFTKAVGAERVTYTVAGWNNPLWTVLEFVNGMTMNAAASVFAAATLATLSVGLFSYLQSRRDLIMLLGIAGTTETLSFIGLGRYLRPRSYFFLAGFVVLIVVRGTIVVGRWLARLLRVSRAAVPWAGSLLSLALILVSAVSIPFAYRPKQDYGGALAFVEAERESTDAVVTVGLASLPYSTYYHTDWQQVQAAEELESIRLHSRRTWLVYTLPVHLRSAYPDVMTLIERDFQTVRTFPGSLGDGTLFVCLSENPAGFSEGYLSYSSILAMETKPDSASVPGENDGE